MTYLGDFTEDATVRRFFNTVDTDGAPITIGGTAAAQVYKDNSTTQITAGITITEDFDGVTGLHLLTVDMSADAGYTKGSDYAAVISVGTADSVSIVGGVLVQWSCENRQTALRDGSITTNTFNSGVLATEEEVATAVWGKDSSSPSLGSYGQLVATTINDNVASILADTGTDGVVVAGSSIDAIWDEPTSGHTTAGTFGEQLKTDVDAILADTNELQTDWVNGGRLDLILDTAAAAGGAPTASQIADAVWDEATSGHTTAGTFGEQLKTDVDAILADTNELQTDWANGGRLDVILDAAATGVTVSTAQVSNERTWYGDDYRARNIVTVGNGFAGVLAVMPDLNPETAIASVSACTISGPTAVSASNLSVRADRMAAHFTVPALTTSGTYTVTCTVLTADSQTIPTTCTLKVV